MARKSAAALSIVRPDPATGAIACPDGLVADEAALWRDIVASKPADWFGPDSAPLLLEYVRAACMCSALDGSVKELVREKAAVEDIKMLLDMRDKEARRAASLATKLRLTQQSKYGPRTADRQDRKAAGKRPWQG